MCWRITNLWLPHQRLACSSIGMFSKSAFASPWGCKFLFWKGLTLDSSLHLRLWLHSRFDLSGNVLLFLYVLLHKLGGRSCVPKSVSFRNGGYNRKSTKGSQRNAIIVGELKFCIQTRIRINSDYWTHKPEIHLSCAERQFCQRHLLGRTWKTSQKTSYIAMISSPLLKKANLRLFNDVFLPSAVHKCIPFSVS